MKTIVYLATLILAFSLSAFSSTLIFDNNYTFLGGYYSDGLMYWGPGWTWNGVVGTPPDYYRQISSDINLYTERAHSHTLFVQVTNLLSGNGASFFGAAFDAVTMVGVQVSNPKLSSLTPSYSGQFANPGEYLEGTLGDCSMSQNVPLTSTPGWNLASAGSGTFVTETVNGSTNGFTGPFGCIYGTFRIINGGVFALDFGKNLKHLSGDFDVSVIYGYNFQTIQATLISQPVPEPGTILTLTCGLLGCLSFGRRSLRL